MVLQAEQVVDPGRLAPDHPTRMFLLHGQSFVVNKSLKNESKFSHSYFLFGDYCVIPESLPYQSGTANTEHRFRFPK